MLKDVFFWNVKIDWEALEKPYIHVLTDERVISKMEQSMVHQHQANQVFSWLEQQHHYNQKGNMGKNLLIIRGIHGAGRTSFLLSIKKTCHEGNNGVYPLSFNVEKGMAEGGLRNCIVDEVLRELLKWEDLDKEEHRLAFCSEYESLLAMLKASKTMNDFQNDLSKIVRLFLKCASRVSGKLYRHLLFLVDDSGDYSDELSLKNRLNEIEELFAFQQMASCIYAMVDEGNYFMNLKENQSRPPQIRLTLDNPRPLYTYLLKHVIEGKDICSSIIQQTGIDWKRGMDVKQFLGKLSLAVCQIPMKQEYQSIFASLMVLKRDSKKDIFTWLKMLNSVCVTNDWQEVNYCNSLDFVHSWQPTLDKLKDEIDTFFVSEDS